MIASACCLIVLGCGGGVDGGPWMDFIDHPEKSKGKTLTAPLNVKSLGGGSLRDRAGKPVQFYRFVGTNSTDVTITMPEKAEEIPNATAGDTVTVTFVCEQGKTNEGNRATAIKR
jgi:hypothetical protein